MNVLPIEVLRIIYSYLDIETISKIINNNILQTEFWRAYFILHNVNITTAHNDPISWIHEYKANQILKYLSDNDQKTQIRNLSAVPISYYIDLIILHLFQFGAIRSSEVFYVSFFQEMYTIKTWSSYYCDLTKINIYQILFEDNNIVKYEQI